MKNYKVLLSDTQYYWVDVEAENKGEAEDKITKILVGGDNVDTYEAKEQYYRGYQVVVGSTELI